MGSDINLNKRLQETFKKLYCSDKQEGYYILDCYNNTIYDNISPTITTRYNASCNMFLVEIFENEE